MVLEYKIKKDAAKFRDSYKKLTFAGRISY